MILINFSHPITEAHKGQIESLTGQIIQEVRDVPAQFDNTRPFEVQIRVLVESIDLEPQVWQSAPILVNPPAYNFAALTLLAELHGRMGYFPAITRIRPVEASTPPRYEVAEIINLQAVRDQARTRRNGEQ